jgi:hypothetical protein
MVDDGTAVPEKFLHNHLNFLHSYLQMDQKQTINYAIVR